MKEFSLGDLLGQYLEIERERYGLGHRWPASPYDEQHYYDYIGALKDINAGKISMGVDPATGELHWPDEHKEFGHPAYSSKWFVPSEGEPQYVQPLSPIVNYRMTGDDAGYAIGDALREYLSKNSQSRERGFLQEMLLAAATAQEPAPRRNPLDDVIESALMKALQR